MSQENKKSLDAAVSVPNSEGVQDSPSEAKSAIPEASNSMRHDLSRVKATLWLYSIITVISVILAYVYLYKRGILPSWMGDLASSLSTVNGLIGGVISGGLVALAGKSSLQYFSIILKMQIGSLQSF